MEERIGARIVDVKVDSVNFLERSANLIVKYDRKDTEITPAYVFPKQTTAEGDEEETLLVRDM